jgi:hypothetical protein
MQTRKPGGLEVLSGYRWRGSQHGKWRVLYWLEQSSSEASSAINLDAMVMGKHENVKKCAIANEAIYLKSDWNVAGGQKQTNSVSSSNHVPHCRCGRLFLCLANSLLQ